MLPFEHAEPLQCHDARAPYLWMAGLFYEIPLYMQHRVDTLVAVIHVGMDIEGVKFVR